MSFLHEATPASSSTSAPKKWSTSSFLNVQPNGRRKNALIILNTPLVHDELFRKIWEASSVRYCADGGANRLYDAYHGQERRSSDLNNEQANKRNEVEDELIPDLIKGDLDSLRDDVRAYYERKGVPIHHDPDEYSTDLGKCVIALTEHEAEMRNTDSSAQAHQLIISGGLSGRLDQTIHTIHALTILSIERDFTWAIGVESLACVLGKGLHEIETSLKDFGDTCGILPVGEEARVTTTGLKWDLGPTSYAYPTSITAGVSSSNHLPQEKVTVETDVPIVWTVEVRGSKY